MVLQMNEINSIRLIVDSLIFMLILLVQIIIYPSFHSISNEFFSSWHYNYMKSISMIIGPLMLIQVFIIITQCLTQSNLINYASLISLLIVWIATITFSIPCHNELQSIGYNNIVVNRLISTNWIRTIFWMITLFLSIVNFYKSI